MISLNKEIIMYLKIDFLQFNTYNKVRINILDGGRWIMETWEELKNWADKTALIHSVKILIDANTDTQEIKREFGLTDSELDKIKQEIKRMER